MPLYEPHRGQKRSRPCEDCEVNWPDYQPYHKCPLCDADLLKTTNVQPIPDGIAADANRLAAERRTKHREFERYCEAYETAMVARHARELEAWGVLRDAPRKPLAPHPKMNHELGSH
jgi:hypothetical protein